MKRIVLKFISIYAEKLGREKLIELEDNVTVRDLSKLISDMIKGIGIETEPLIFVNYRFTREDQVLRDGDEVLVMPPFAGGI